MEQERPSCPESSAKERGLPVNLFNVGHVLIAPDDCMPISPDAITTVKRITVQMVNSIDH